MVTVYANRDDYRPGKDSVLVEDGRVRAFDKTKTVASVRGVEISYAILTKPVLDLLPEADELVRSRALPAARAPRRARRLRQRPPLLQRRVARAPAGHGAFSRSSTDRHPRSRRDAQPTPAASPVRHSSATSSSGCPAHSRRLRLLEENGYRVVVVSNQAGIGRGAMTEADLEAVHARMLEDAGGVIEAIYHCPHDWDAGCECRKPAPGMLFQAQRDLDLDLTRTPFLGDDERDGQAAAGGRLPVHDGLGGAPAPRRRARAGRAARGGAEMRVLVTGHEGYIGSVLAPDFLERGLRRGRPRHGLLRGAARSFPTALRRSRQSGRTSATSAPATSRASTRSSTSPRSPTTRSGT